MNDSRDVDNFNSRNKIAYIGYANSNHSEMILLKKHTLITIDYYRSWVKMIAFVSESLCCGIGYRKTSTNVGIL